MQNHYVFDKTAGSSACCSQCFSQGGLHARAWLSAAAITFAVVLIAAVVSIAPQQAFAKSYSMPQTTINAEVQQNGDLHVVEQRQFEFDGTYAAVWWEFTGLPSGADVKVNSVSMADVDGNGSFAESDLKGLSSTPFQVKWRDEGGPGNVSYSMDEGKETLYVFFNESNSRIVVQLDYTVQKAAQAYSDVGEVYWKFVGDSWGADSENVSMTIKLPVAAGQDVVAGSNVRAWGHGPLNAAVSIGDDGTISYQIPSVSSGSYAEARVVFPTQWLSAVSSADDNAHESTARLDSVLSEEQTWADRANAQRAQQLGVLVFAIVVCILLLVWAIRSFVKYGKELEPAFKDEYWRDVPEKGQHPAVIGRLCRFDKESSLDFSATIMHLANAGALLINRGSYDKSRLFGSKKVDDYYLTRVPEVELALNSELDRKAMSFLFDTVGGGEPSLWLTSIKQYAKDHPKAFNEAMADWQGLVTAHVIAADYFESYSKSKRNRMAAVAAVLLFAGIGIAVCFNNLLVLVPCIVTSVALMVVSQFMERRTQKGADAYARCMALKKWLTEFSSLDERPAADVKVWGEFMVYAYLFGVAKEAIEELRRAVPEMFEVDSSLAADTAYVPWWVWYAPYGHGVYADMPDFGSMLETSVTESLQAVDSALSGGSSSGGGFGGGFSVGGGGGFGGGGGAR